ncbi:MAG: sulfurtransferase complex subunit TusD [Cellvibrionaceae bacterium]
MKYALAIYGAPTSSQSAHTAFRFAETLLDEGHELYRVFFYHDAVYAGSSLVSPPQDEQNLPNLWGDLAEKHGIDLVVCIAAAVRRGVIDARESGRYDKASHNLSEGFELSGLGQLVDAAVEVDRLITFGA